MFIAEQDVLRWLHILAMVYWLGGEWGVFQTSYNVANPRLTLEERKRHMETAYRIDILARTGIIMLLPLGIHMGFNLGAHEYGGGFLTGMWIVFAGWLALTWSAFFARETDLGIRLTKIDEAIRYVVIPSLLGVGLYSLVNGAPLTQNWYAAKVVLYGLMLCIGLALRFIMRHWTTIFRALAEKPGDAVLEAKLASELRVGRGLAYVYWIGIATTCFLGATKPF